MCVLYLRFVAALGIGMLGGSFSYGQLVHGSAVEFRQGYLFGTPETDNGFTLGLPLTVSESYSWFRQLSEGAVPPIYPGRPIPSLVGVNFTLAETVDYFLVQEGDVLNESTALSGIYEQVQFEGVSPVPVPPVNVADPPLLGTSFSHDFYLGLHAPKIYLHTQTDINGWVHLRITENGFEMLANAVNYGDPRGVVVGRLPEPSSFAVMMAASPLIVKRRRRPDCCHT